MYDDVVTSSANIVGPQTECQSAFQKISGAFHLDCVATFSFLGLCISTVFDQCSIVLLAPQIGRPNFTRVPKRLHVVRECERLQGVTFATCIQTSRMNFKWHTNMHRDILSQTNNTVEIMSKQKRYLKMSPRTFSNEKPSKNL